MVNQRHVCAVKEQEKLIKTFTFCYTTGGIYSAWRYYSRLDSTSKANLRKYRSDNGVVDFPFFLQRIQDSRLCGIAGRYEQLSLIDAVNKELENLSKRERKSYLNGNLLSFNV